MENFKSKVHVFDSA